MPDQPRSPASGPAPGRQPPTLLVFLHVALTQRAFQSELQAALGDIGVTAVGRTADFDRGLAERPDAVLSLPVVLAAHGLPTNLQGIRNRSTEETCVLAGVDAPPDPAKVASVGVLDYLGREGMNRLVLGLLGRQPKVERVTKVEDLLPLLQLQRVDAILLPLRLLGEVRAPSRLNVVTRELPRGIGLPAVATVGPRGPQVMQAIRRLPPPMVKSLGVSEWR
jgi:hypothetical protein